MTAYTNFGYHVQKDDGEVVKINEDQAKHITRINNDSKYGTEMESFGNEVYKKQLGLNTNDLVQWKINALKTHEELNEKAQKLSRIGLVPDGMEVPEINVVSQPNAAVAISLAQATEVDGKAKVGFAVDINGNYNYIGATKIRHEGNYSELKEASGIGETNEQKAFNKANTEITLYHEIGHGVLDHMLKEGRAVLKDSTMTDEQAKAFQDYMISGKKIENGELKNESYNGSTVTSKTGQVIHENFADAYAAVCYLKANNYSHEAQNNLRQLAKLRQDDDEAHFQKDREMVESNNVNFAGFDEHRMGSAITSVLDNVENLKKMNNEQMLNFVGETSFKSAAMSLGNQKFEQEGVNPEKSITLGELFNDFELNDRVNKAKEVTNTTGNSEELKNFQAATEAFRSHLKDPHPDVSVKPQLDAVALTNENLNDKVVPGGKVLAKIESNEELRNLPDPLVNAVLNKEDVVPAIAEVRRDKELEMQNNTVRPSVPTM